MKVSDAMHADARWVAADTPVTDIVKIMAEQDIGSVPVGENDRLVGMVTDRDIALRTWKNGRDPQSMTARDIMTEGIVYCRTNETVEDAIRLMEQKQIRRLPVINDDKRMVGMLGIGDISHAMSREMTGELVRAVSAHHD